MFGLGPEAPKRLVQLDPVLTAETVDHRYGGRKLPADPAREHGQHDKTGETKCERKDPEHVVSLLVGEAVAGERLAVE